MTATFYADAAFPGLALIARCAVVQLPQLYLGKSLWVHGGFHNAGSPRTSLRQPDPLPLSTQQTSRQPLRRGCSRRRADAIFRFSRLWSGPRSKEEGWEGRREDALRTNTWPGEETHELVGSSSWRASRTRVTLWMLRATQFSLCQLAF